MESRPHVETQVNSFSNDFVGTLARHLSDTTGAAWKITESSPAERGYEGSPIARVTLSCTDALEGQALLEFGTREAIALVSKVTKQPVNQFGTAELEALIGVVQGAADEFRPKAKLEYGVLGFHVSGGDEEGCDYPEGHKVTVCDDRGNQVTVVIWLDTLLSAALGARLVEGRGHGLAGAGVRKALREAVPDQANLDLVLDVELNVTLRFGKRQLTLREVLDLTTGSVVELDRQVEEPVELLLDGVPIAKGEAVVVDGNYGLRVTEVM